MNPPPQAAAGKLNARRLGAHQHQLGIAQIRSRVRCIDAQAPGSVAGPRRTRPCPREIAACHHNATGQPRRKRKRRLASNLPIATDDHHLGHRGGS